MRNHAAHALFFATALLLPYTDSILAQVPTALDNTKITPANQNVGKLLELSNDTIAGAQVTLLDLLKIEYQLPIHGLTHEQETTRFDVTARIDPPGIADPVHNPRARTFLIDALLKNHFQLKAHEAMVDVTTEQLIVSPGGIKLTPAPAAVPARCPCPRSPRPNRARDGTISMSGLARRLADQFHIEVVDRTNVQGNFITDLNWLPKLDATPQSVEQVLRPALETHLGLTLLPIRRQEKAIIIDNIELPASVIWLEQRPDITLSAESPQPDPH